MELRGQRCLLATLLLPSLLGLQNNICDVFGPIWNKKEKIIKFPSKQDYIFSPNIQLLLATSPLDKPQRRSEVQHQGPDLQGNLNSITLKLFQLEAVMVQPVQLPLTLRIRILHQVKNHSLSTNHTSLYLKAHFSAFV